MMTLMEDKKKGLVIRTIVIYMKKLRSSDCLKTSALFMKTKIIQTLVCTLALVCNTSAKL